MIKKMIEKILVEIIKQGAQGSPGHVLCQESSGNSRATCIWQGQRGHPGATGTTDSARNSRPTRLERN